MGRKLEAKRSFAVVANTLQTGEFLKLHVLLKFEIRVSHDLGKRFYVIEVFRYSWKCNPYGTH